MSTVPPPDPTPSTPGVPAGWYPDATTGSTRWWNGEEWTNDVATPPTGPDSYVYGQAGAPQVGYPAAYPGPVPAGNNIAIAATVLGAVAVVVRLASVILFGSIGGARSVLALAIVVVPAILAIVFGALGLARARRIGSGRPLAIIGLALGVLLLLLTAVGLVGLALF